MNINSLFKIKPKDRLGADGAKCIKSHPFFSEIDWDKLYEGRYEAPFKPKLLNEKDLRNFDKEFTDEAIRDTPATEIHENYDRFTYVRS